MPEWSGIYLLRQIELSQSNIHFVFITSENIPGSGNLHRTAVQVSWISEPFRPEDARKVFLQFWAGARSCQNQVQLLCRNTFRNWSTAKSRLPRQHFLRMSRSSSF